MTCHQEIVCPTCGSNQIRKAGFNARGVRRYCCENSSCSMKSFMLTYRYKGCEPMIEEKIIEMAINSSGIRDTARVLGIAKGTVISTLKKKRKQSSK